VISKADEKTATSWLKAAEAAHQAGLQGIAVEEAFFEVRFA
jgi:2-iminoacetate synthase ThiH